MKSHKQYNYDTQENKNKNIEYLESMFCEIISNPYWCTNLELQIKLERTHYLMD